MSDGHRANGPCWHGAGLCSFGGQCCLPARNWCNTKGGDGPAYTIAGAQRVTVVYRPWAQESWSLREVIGELFTEESEAEQGSGVAVGEVRGENQILEAYGAGE